MRLYLWTSPANIKWKALPAYQGLYLKPDCILLCFFLFLPLRPTTTSILPSSQPNCKEDRVQSWGQSCFPWMFRSDLYSRLLFWGEHFLSNIFYAPIVVFKEMKASLSFFFFSFLFLADLSAFMESFITHREGGESDVCVCLHDWGKCQPSISHLAARKKFSSTQMHFISSILSICIWPSACLHLKIFKYLPSNNIPRSIIFILGYNTINSWWLGWFGGWVSLGYSSPSF